MRLLGSQYCLNFAQSDAHNQCNGQDTIVRTIARTTQFRTIRGSFENRNRTGSKNISHQKFCDALHHQFSFFVMSSDTRAEMAIVVGVDSVRFHLAVSYELSHGFDPDEEYRIGLSTIKSNDASSLH
jgi:hypothetical protein